MASQVYEMVKGAEGIEELLVGRKFPFQVYYGPTHPEPSGGATLLTFARDRLAHEPVSAPAGTGPQRRPAAPLAPTLPGQTVLEKLVDRAIGVECRIYARDNQAGAMVQDHEELADYLADGVITAVLDWCKAQGSTPPVFNECRYLLPDELVTDRGEPEHFPGVVYVVRFQIGRGVYKRTFEKLGKGVGLIAGVSNEADVRLKEDDPPVVVPF